MGRADTLLDRAGGVLDATDPLLKRTDAVLGQTEPLVARPAVLDQTEPLAEQAAHCLPAPARWPSRRSADAAGR